MMLVRLGNLIGYVSDRTSRSRFAVFACFVIAGVMESIKDEVLAHVPVAALSMTVIDSVMVGGAVAIAMWLLLASFRERRDRVRSELQRIAELNHEVRNALQVLVHSQFDADPERRKLVVESVDRINVVLARLFPVIGVRR